MPAPAFKAAIGCADVVLDSIGWSGCNSLVDALAHGLPIVTTPGDTMRSRHGAAILRRLGQHEQVSADIRAYIDRAVALGRDPGLRLNIRSELRASLHLLNDPTPARELERHIIAACAAGIPAR